MIMSQDVYSRLAAFLDTLAGGFPQTKSGVEIRILKKLFSPDEAELTMQLKETPETVSEISSRIGKPETELAEQLERMAQKGLIFRVWEGNTSRYRSAQFAIGIYQFQLKTLDRELSELVVEYSRYFGKSMAQVKTESLRRIPLGSVVKSLSDVAPYNDVRELIKDQDFIAVQECLCRKTQGLLRGECSYPREFCFSFGDFGRFFVDNGMARRIDLEETLKLLDQAEEKGLVLTPSNSQKIEQLCCCCSCCCPSLMFAKMSKRPVDMIKSYYLAKIDPDLCIACGACAERCPMDAINLEGEVSEIRDERCIGCGLCISACPVEAISLNAKPGMLAPPIDATEIYQRVKKERGLA